MEDTDQDKGHRKLSKICKLLQMIYPEFQLYSKAIKWVEREERMEMEKRTPTGFWRTQRQNNKSTGTLSSEERRKIQSGNGCFRTHNRRSTILRTRREMETNSIFIKNNVASGKKLRNL